MTGLIIVQVMVSTYFFENSKRFSKDKAGNISAMSLVLFKFAVVFARGLNLKTYFGDAVEMWS